jgi:acyl dehydratase
MQKFSTVNSLYQYLLNENVLIFETKIKKLSQFKVLLFSLATGDFNPAHCVPAFARHSVFKSVVSQGIATLARAEAEFLKMLQFEEPVEVITSGLSNARYIAPLKVGDRYKYRFTISNLQKRKDLWKMECAIECIVVADGEKVIATWGWHPIFDVKKGLSKDEEKLLKPKSYWRNVFEQFVLRPTSFEYLLTLGFVGEILFVVKLIILISPLYFPVELIVNFLTKLEMSFGPPYVSAEYCGT